VADEIGGIAVPGDATDEDDVREFVQAAGPVRCLVANATGPQPVVGFEGLTWRTHLDQLEFFVKSPTLLAQAVVPGMKQSGGGKIIHIGSDMPRRALPGWSAYSAAKAALEALTRTWAKELAAHNIAVNLVAPGWVPVERHADSTPETRAAYAGEVPLRRLGTPQDIADTVAFLARAGGINGQTVTVNGGHTIAW
jgi:NAD(P)-dependent dehydrogenase (short-subunit alcohol dehydrogenase family)